MQPVDIEQLSAVTTGHLTTMDDFNISVNVFGEHTNYGKWDDDVLKWVLDVFMS